MSEELLYEKLIYNKSNIAFVFAFLLIISGCIDKPHEEKNAPSVKSGRQKIIIHKIEQKIPEINLAGIPEASVYQNLTQEFYQIGQLVEADISILVPAEYNYDISHQSATEFGKQILVSQEEKKSSWLVRIVFDNDIFSNTDYYYTHGAKIELVIPFLKRSPINKIFFAPTNYNIEFCGFSITQNIYTPTNPDTKDILYGDRPFSSYLAVGQFREVYNLTKNVSIKSQLNLGVIGPSSLGGQVQSSIHELTPVGWQNQINNDFVVDYSFQIQKGIVNNSLIDLNVNGKANIGTLYNKIGGGLNFRIGHFTPFYSGPMSMYTEESSTGPLQYWFFVRSAANVIGYDATLQGGMFKSDNPYTINTYNLNRFVVEASAGVALYYNNLGLEYEHFYLSPEFKRARHFGWGRITAVLTF